MPQSKSLLNTMPLPDSEVFNVEFVQTIELYRCLYDVTLPEYSSKDEQDRAWQIIGHKYSATPSECKLRWKYLRGGLTRYSKKLKEMNGQDIKFKQFYLWDVMQFVIPFLKQRQTLRGSAPYFYLRNDGDPSQVKGENQSHDNDDEGEDDEDTSRETSQTPSLPLAESTPASVKRPRKRFWTPDSFERPPPPSESPDLQFFRSIVPDVALFNPSQKRRFKLRVLQLLEEMSAENPPVCVPMPPEISPAPRSLLNEAVAVALRPVISNETAAVRPVMTNEVPSIRPVMSNGGPARPVSTNSSYSTASTEYTIYQQAPGSQQTIYR